MSTHVVFQQKIDFASSDFVILMSVCELLGVIDYGTALCGLARVNREIARLEEDLEERLNQRPPLPPS